MADTYKLDPAVRIEEILNGDDIEPANRLEYFLKKTVTDNGGGGYDFGSPEDYEPFNVPDLINGGTRLFTPGVDATIYAQINGALRNVLGNNAIGLFTEKTPPGYYKPSDENDTYIAAFWRYVTTEAYSSTGQMIPGFALVENANIVRVNFYNDDVAFIINPANIVYREIPFMKEEIL